MDLNTKFRLPQQVEGEIPSLGQFKTRIRYPRIFNFASDDHCAALDMWFALLSDQEKSFVINHGLTKVKYISHQHGVAVGKAFTEYVKSNFLLLTEKGLKPEKLMYFETLFGFTQGMNQDTFYQDVAFD